MILLDMPEAEIIYLLEKEKAEKERTNLST
jgi:hypothetical protein